MGDGGSAGKLNGGNPVETVMSQERLHHTVQLQQNPCIQRGIGQLGSGQRGAVPGPCLLCLIHPDAEIVVRHRRQARPQRTAAWPEQLSGQHGIEDWKAFDSNPHEKL